MRGFPTLNWRVDRIGALAVLLPAVLWGGQEGGKVEWPRPAPPGPRAEKKCRPFARESGGGTNCAGGWCGTFGPRTGCDRGNRATVCWEPRAAGPLRLRVMRSPVVGVRGARRSGKVRTMRPPNMARIGEQRTSTKEEAQASGGSLAVCWRSSGGSSTESEQGSAHAGGVLASAGGSPAAPSGGTCAIASRRDSL
jgi:hypothetical protein